LTVFILYAASAQLIAIPPWTCFWSLVDVVFTGAVSCQAQAIAEQVTICVSDAVKSLFLSQYPSMLYILADYSHTGRMIATGKCGAAIVQESAYGEMQRGAYHMADCRAMDAGLLTAEEAQCYRDSNGGIVPSRDCWIQKVRFPWTCNVGSSTN
jgi:hypothetical protein